MSPRIGCLLFAYSAFASLSFSGTLAFTGVNAATGLGSANSGTHFYVQVDGANVDAYWVGGMDISVDGHSRLVFCIDAFTDIYIGSTNSTTVTLPDLAPVQQAAWVLNHEWNLLTTAPSDATTGQIGAAMQLALWDIVQNNSSPLAAAQGRIQISSDPLNPTDATVARYAQQFITESLGQASVNAFVYNNVCTANAPVCGVTSQTLLGQAAFDGGASPTPEPATSWLSLLGAAGVFLVRFARSRRKRLPPPSL